MPISARKTRARYQIPFQKVGPRAGPEKENGEKEHKRKEKSYDYVEKYVNCSKFH